MTSSDESDVDLTAPKKKYKLWKDNDTEMIPLRTLTRYESKMTSFKNQLSTVNARNITELRGQSIANDDWMGCESECIISDENTDSEDSLEECDYNPDEINEMTAENNSIEIENNFDGARVELAYEQNNDDSNGDSDDDDNYQQVIGVIIQPDKSFAIDEGVLDLLDIYVRNKWTKTSLAAILKFIHKSFPENNFPKSVYRLFNYVQNLVPAFKTIKHYYCRQCLTYNHVDPKIDKCCACNSNKSNISFFFEVDICEQIKYMFENQNLADKLRKPLVSHSNNIISDIMDGSEYLRVNQRVNRNAHDLTIMLNTDGLSLVNCAKSHCWPLTFTIMELPEYLRESYLTTIGLWYDKDLKPDMNLFLKPFCIKLKQCFNEGISWVDPKTGQKNISKIVAPLIIADAPARAAIQNVLCFNGRYGCNVCELKMKKSKVITNRKTTRVYPVVKYNDIKLRTGIRMYQLAKKVNLSDNISHIKGVKGHSTLTQLPFLDLGTCLIPEYMHSVLLGVEKQLIKLWPEKIKTPWSIKEHMEEIDSFLLDIRPPDFFNRMPRRLTESHFYKASEFYNFLLFYSLPALQSYLPLQYFYHWMLLVKAIYLLLQGSITRHDIQEARSLLELFVKNVESLYGDRQLTYNVHQMLHLPLIVERWGPLWATSAFMSENFNGMLAHNVQGSKNFGQEIVNNLKIAQGVRASQYKVNSQKIRENTKKMKLQVIGGEEVVQFNEKETKLFDELNINKNLVLVYSRAHLLNDTYTSKLYKNTKTNSYTVRVQLKDKTILKGSIKYFFTAESNVYVALECFNIEHDKMFFNPKTLTKIDHILPIRENTDNLKIINSETIMSMYHLIRVHNYVCNRPNYSNQIL